MKRLSQFIFLILILLLVGCAASVKESTKEVGRLVITDISKGLPTAGLWRESIALADFNGDGLLDIVVPPPRKAKEGMNRPFIFIREEKGERWIEGNYDFPAVGAYNYGGIAIGDLNMDGFPDIILASHGNRIIPLLNNKKDGFIEGSFPNMPDFQSRTVALSDINGDGYSDIIAFSEAPLRGKENKRYFVKNSIIVWVNKSGKDWDIRPVEGSDRMHGDSMVVEDVNGDGKKDIVVAPLTAIKKLKNPLWVGDGSGDFKNYPADFIGEMVPFIVRTGDLDGDGRNELIFKLSGSGNDASIVLKVIKWTGDGFEDLSQGIDLKSPPIVYDIADIDGNGRGELVVLALDGLHIFRYKAGGWREVMYHPIRQEDTEGARDLRLGRQKDGSWIIVYNLGAENPSINNGIKALLLRQ